MSPLKTANFARWIILTSCIAKDSEIRQATTELETQLRTAAESLSEFKLRAANAETRLSEVSSDASKSTALEKELKDKNQIIGKLRHDGELIAREPISQNPDIFQLW